MGTRLNAHRWGGGAYSASLSNSRTSRPSETGEVAIESSRQYDAKECLKFFIQGQDHGLKRCQRSNNVFRITGCGDNAMNSSATKVEVYWCPRFTSPPRTPITKKTQGLVFYFIILPPKNENKIHNSKINYLTCEGSDLATGSATSSRYQLSRDRTSPNASHARKFAF